MTSFFSLGAILGRCWSHDPTPFPWALVASAWLACALWDPLARGGSIDFILVGLAAYELAIGFTERTGVAG